VRLPNRCLQLVLVAAALAVVVPASSASSGASFTIRGDYRIGSFRVKADGTLGGVIAAFGEPDTLRRRFAEACNAVWRSSGLTILFNNFGGQNPCTPEGGRFARALMHGRRWRTGSGLRIGMLASAVSRYYPRATYRRGVAGFWPSGWWLVTRRSPFGTGDTRYPGLLAETQSGRVAAFYVSFPAGGD
jgi:hypothetical protein